MVQLVSAPHHHATFIFHFPVPSLHPVLKYIEKHDAIRVPAFIVRALDSRNFDMISESIDLEDRAGLRVEAAHYNSLMHASQGHAEQEKTGYLNVTGQVHKDLS